VRRSPLLLSIGPCRADTSFSLADQKLKARLKRFESARVPTNLRNERLFEVRFFDGLPKCVFFLCSSRSVRR